MSQDITLLSVRKEAINTIEKLHKKEIDHKTAGEIRNLLNVIIDTAKVQIEFMKALPTSVKEKMTHHDLKQMVGACNDKDAEVNETLARLKAENPIKEVERKETFRNAM